jgi:hypothetical protein
MRIGLLQGSKTRRTRTSAPSEPKGTPSRYGTPAQYPASTLRVPYECVPCRSRRATPSRYAVLRASVPTLAHRNGPLGSARLASNAARRTSTRALRPTQGKARRWPCRSRRSTQRLVPPRLLRTRRGASLALRRGVPRSPPPSEPGNPIYCGRSLLRSASASPVGLMRCDAATLPQPKLQESTLPCAPPKTTRGSMLRYTFASLVRIASAR